MQFSLDDIDKLRKRANVGYRQAREALEQAGGDLVEALIRLEESLEKPLGKASERSKGWYQQVRQTAGRLHQTRVKVKVRDSTLVELPVTLGALGTVLFPKAAAVGLVGLLLFNGSLEVGGGEPEGKQDDAGGRDAAAGEPEKDKSLRRRLVKRIGKRLQ